MVRVWLVAFSWRKAGVRSRPAGDTSTSAVFAWAATVALLTPQNTQRRTAEYARRRRVFTHWALKSPSDD